MFETGKRLTIIVPYRDRESQLRNWLPYLRLYFARDKIDRHIEVRFLVVEQANDLPFNRGRLLNIGFVLAEESSDYVCFHDVDYMPLWADYSYSAQPTRIIWYGADIKPIDPASNVRVQEHEESFFGAVVLFPNERFRQVNGFSNTYWGWGFEDNDLRQRCLCEGLTPQRRLGTFRPQHHRNHGLNLDATLTPAAQANKRVYDARLPVMGRDHPHRRDGLSSLVFTESERRPLTDLGGDARALLVRVDFPYEAPWMPQAAPGA